MTVLTASAGRSCAISSNCSVAYAIFFDVETWPVACGEKGEVTETTCGSLVTAPSVEAIRVRFARSSTVPDVAAKTIREVSPAAADDAASSMCWTRVLSVLGGWKLSW